MNKRYISMVVIAGIVLGLVGCGKSSEASSVLPVLPSSDSLQSTEAQDVDIYEADMLSMQTELENLKDRLEDSEKQIEQLEQEIVSLQELSASTDNTMAPPGNAPTAPASPTIINNTTSTLTIPILRYLSIDEAEAMLNAMGLVPVQVKLDNPDREDSQHIVRTEPVPGTSVQPGSAVTLYIYAEHYVPDLSGYIGGQIAPLEEFLTANKLSYGIVGEYSDIPKDTVIAIQQPKSGSVVTKDTIIGITVSYGPLIPDPPPPISESSPSP